MSFTVPPDACTLPTAEQPLRLAEFDHLFATSVRRVERIGPTHTRMHLAGQAGLAPTVRDLAARESACCSFFTFALTPQPVAEGESLLLDIEVPPAYTEVLATLTERADAVATKVTP